MNLRKIFNPAGRRRKRYERICEILNITSGDRILDVGCGHGISFECFNCGNEIVGVDIRDSGYKAENFRFVEADAESMPFDDKEFDIVVSIGVLEHIRPMQKLDKCIKEIDRVGKKSLVVVHCIDTLLEPHFHKFGWQMKSYEKRLRLANRSFGFEHAGKHERLNYLSDDAWLNFEGFAAHRTQRYWHIPPIMRNLFIFKNG